MELVCLDVNRSNQSCPSIRWMKNTHTSLEPVYLQGNNQLHTIHSRPAAIKMALQYFSYLWLNDRIYASKVICFICWQGVPVNEMLVPAANNIVFYPNCICVHLYWMILHGVVHILWNVKQFCCIDTIEQILSDWRDTDENLKKWELDLYNYIKS